MMKNDFNQIKAVEEQASAIKNQGKVTMKDMEKEVTATLNAIKKSYQNKLNQDIKKQEEKNKSIYDQQIEQLKREHLEAFEKMKHQVEKNQEETIQLVLKEVQARYGNR